MTGSDFKALRRSLGLSQREMGEILGVSWMTVLRAEQRGPTKALLAYLERALAKGKLRISDKKTEPEDLS